MSINRAKACLAAFLISAVLPPPALAALPEGFLLNNGRLELTLDPGELSVAGDLRVRFEENHFVISSAQCLTVNADNVAVAAYRLSLGEFTLCPTGEPAALTFIEDRLTVKGRLTPFALSLTDAQGDTQASGTVPALSFNGDVAFANSLRMEGRFDLAGGDLTYRPFVRAREIDASGTLKLTGRERRAELSLDRLHIDDPSHTPRFAPMHLSGPVSLAGDRVSWRLGFEAASGPGKGASIGRLTGRHDLATGHGTTDAEGTLAFAAGGLGPRAISPLVPAMLEDVTGRIDYQADLAWGRAFDGTAQATLDNVGFAIGETKVSGVDGDLYFAKLNPIATRGTQTLDVGTIETAVALDEGAVTFALPGDDTLTLEDAHWRFAEGTLGVRSEQPIAFDGKEQHLVVSFDKVEVAELVKMIDLPGLSGTGELVGEVPVLIRDGAPVFQRGTIRSTPEGGIIRYTGVGDDVSEAGGEASILVNAMRNFHYKELSAELIGSPQDAPTSGSQDSDGVTLALKLEGSNPDLYDGYPFEINVRTRGDLMDLFQKGSVGFRPLDLIENKGVEDVPAPE